MLGDLGRFAPDWDRTKAAAVCDGTVRQLQNGLTAYFEYYNQERPPQSLNHPRRPEEHSLL